MTCHVVDTSKSFTLRFIWKPFIYMYLYPRSIELEFFGSIRKLSPIHKSTTFFYVGWSQPPYFCFIVGNHCLFCGRLIRISKFFLKYIYCPQIVWLCRRLLLLLLLLQNTDRPQQLEDNVKGYTWKMVKATVELGCLEYHGTFELISCSR